MPVVVWYVTYFSQLGILICRVSWAWHPDINSLSEESKLLHFLVPSGTVFNDVFAFILVYGYWGSRRPSRWWPHLLGTISIIIFITREFIHDHNIKYTFADSVYCELQLISFIVFSELYSFTLINQLNWSLITSLHLKLTNICCNVLRLHNFEAFLT